MLFQRVLEVRKAFDRCGGVWNGQCRQLRSAARAPNKRGTMPTTMTWGGGGVDVALGRRASMEVEAGRVLAQHQDEQAALLSSGKKDYSYSDALPGADRCGGGSMASVWKGVM